MVALKDFWNISMTSLRRVSNNELIDEKFVNENGDRLVLAVFPNISTKEIMVLLQGDCDEEEDW